MRFAWRAATLTVVLVGAVSVASLLFWQDRVRDAVEDGVEAHLKALETELDLAAVDLASTSTPVILPTPEQFVQVITPTGRVVAASSELVTAGPVLLPGDVSSLPEQGLTVQMTDPRDSDQEALIRARSLDVNGTELIGVVGASLRPVTEARGTAIRILVIGVPLLAIVIGYGVWLAVTYAIRPVTSLAREADSLAKGFGPWELSTKPETVELRSLAESLEGLLDHIRAVFEAERRFLDDASHELRTPIAVARGELDLLRSSVSDDLGQTEALSSSIEELDRLDRLAADLLVLARTRGSRPEVMRPADLGGIARRAGAAVMRQPGQRSVDVRIHGDARTVGDEEALARAFLNLVGNAVRHCRTAVDVHLFYEGDKACSLVVDDGPGFPPELIGNSFERFASGRDRRRPGAGLGLAIASAIVKAHGGTLTTSNVIDGGGAVTVRVPAWHHDPGAAPGIQPPQPHPPAASRKPDAG